MMVTIANGDSLLAPLLTGKTNKMNLVQVYSSLIEKLSDEDSHCQLADELHQSSPDLVDTLCTDMENSNQEVVAVVVQLLRSLLHTKAVVETFSEAAAVKLVRSTCQLVQSTGDRSICTNALSCLAYPFLPAAVLESEIEHVLAAIESALCAKNFQSMIVENEGLDAIIRLLQQVPDQMKPHAERWAKLLYPLLVHGAAKIRERAVVAMDLGMPLIVEKQQEVARMLMADLKGKDREQSFLLEQITRLMNNKQEVMAMKVWVYYVNILGKLLHHGQLINQLLPFVEQAFKNSSPEVKCAAYRSWVTLISNFALNPDIVSDGKRVKLVMQVFKLSNAKTESVAIAKLDAWWHFVRKIGSKAPIYFDSVVVPLLNFCVGGLQGRAVLPGTSSSRTPTMSRLAAGIASPGTPNHPGSPAPQFRNLQLRGAHLIARLLGPPLEDASLPKADLILEPLEEELITGPSFFVKHADVLISVVKECISNLQNDLQDGLLYHIWYSLVAHIKNVLEHSTKKDAADVLGTFLSALRHLVTSQSLSPERLLKLVQVVLSLPDKVLASSSFATVTSQTGMMQGTPVLLLLDLLFHHRLLEMSASHERFFVLFEKLVVCGMSNQSGALALAKAVLQLIDQSATKVEQKESVWRMWSLVVNPLLEHILKTNEVNAGDALEHDFSCMYAGLQLPLLHLLNSTLSPHALKSMMRTWTELYTTFARLAAMVTNAEANVCCEELCSRILGMLDNNRDKLSDIMAVEMLTQVCQTVVAQIDFSSVKGAGQFSTSALLMSPGKFMTKKKMRPLGNLHSFIKLLVLVSEAVCNLSESSQNKEKPVSTATLQTAGLSLLDVLSHMFAHLPASAAIIISGALTRLSPVLGRLYMGSAQKPPGRLFSGQLMIRLERLWQDLTTCLQSRYQGSFDSDLLTCLAPLLASTFHHPRRPIRNQTTLLWNATFANAAILTYPAELKSVLAKVKEKTPLKLPGWESTEIVVVEETPASQMSQGAESQVPLPNIAGLPSPHKAVGSFMNKVASPEVKRSPLKMAKSPAGSARKKLGLDDMASQDFVVITPSSKKKRILTDHQKEVLQEKSVLPAMYNNLDASVDRSVMSQFSHSIDTMSQDDSKPPISFSAAINKKSPSPSKAEPLKKTDEKKCDDDKADVGTEQRPRTRRKSVTFASSPKKNVNVGDASICMESERQEPKSLLGQPLEDKFAQAEDNSEIKMEESVEVVPNSECSQGTPTKSEDAVTPDSSERILKQREPKKKAAGQRGLRSSTGSQAQTNDSESSIGRETRARSASSGIGTRSSSAKLDKWITLAPKKAAEEGCMILAEETEQFSPSKHAAAGDGGKVDEGMVVEETPVKVDAEDARPAAADPLDKATKQLFVPDSEVVPATDGESEASPTGQLTVPDTQSQEETVFYPVVQLSRLTNKQLEQYSPKKQPPSLPSSGSSPQEASEDGVKKVDAATTTTATTVRKLPRRRSSIKFSRASQEAATALISPVNMDDIIPSSQDVFSLSERSAAPVQDEPSTAQDSPAKCAQPESATATDICVPREEDRPGDECAMEVDSGPSPTPDSVNPVLGETEDVTKNPDILPMNSMSGSQDSNCTLVGRSQRRRKQPKKKGLKVDGSDHLAGFESKEEDVASADCSQEVARGRGRSGRRRSVPGKFRDTDNTSASGLTPEKLGTRTRGSLQLRPACTLTDQSEGEGQQDTENTEAPVPTQDEVPVISSFIPRDLASNESNSVEVLPLKIQPDFTNDEDDEDDDDLPLLFYKREMEAPTEKGEEEQEKQEEKVEDEPELVTEGQAVKDDVKSIVESKSESDDIMSVDDIFADSTRTSTPAKVEKKRPRRARRSLGDLTIDMKTSPSHRTSRSRNGSCLNRSLNALQKRRHNPHGKLRRRSRSVSPARRQLRAKRTAATTTTTNSVSQDAGQEEGPVCSRVDTSKVMVVETMPNTALEGQEMCTLEPSQEQQASERDTGHQEPATPFQEDSPSQKTTLSPTRPSLNKSLELTDTPTSASKHGSRARLILERSRLVSATRSSSLLTRKFTTLKATTAESAPGDSPCRSILKAGVSSADSSEVSDTTHGSPSASGPSITPLAAHHSPTFRSVQLPKIYSPSASPSAGILKKRKLSGEIPVDSPSPPNKQRRVSFNEAVDVCTLLGKDGPTRPVNRCLDMPRGTRLTSPLVASSSKVTANQAKFITSLKDSVDSVKDLGLFAMPQPIVQKKKDLEQSPGSLRSTIESQLDSQDPIFPELLTCSEPIDHILPQLTSSTWIRGLGQLLCSRNIRTVGDLGALTEYDVNNLPIRTPKVTTVRNVLEAYKGQLELRRPRPETNTETHDGETEVKSATANDKQVAAAKEVDVDNDTTQDDLPKVLESPTKEPLPSLEDALQMSPINDADSSMESGPEMHLDLPGEDAVVSLPEDAVVSLPAAEDPQEVEVADIEYHVRDPLASGTSQTPSQMLADTEDKETQEFTAVGESSALKLSENEEGEKRVVEESEDHLDEDGWDVAQSSRQLLRDMSAMARKLTPEVLSRLPANYLVAMHVHLNTMTTNVIVAQSNQCPLSPSSQSQSE